MAEYIKKYIDDNDLIAAGYSSTGVAHCYKKQLKEYEIRAYCYWGEGIDVPIVTFKASIYYTGNNRNFSIESRALWEEKISDIEEWLQQSYMRLISSSPESQ